MKGPLELPPGAHAPQAQAQPEPLVGTTTTSMSAPRTASEMADSVSPHPAWDSSKSKSGKSTSADALKGAQRPDQPFILDGLL